MRMLSLGLVLAKPMGVLQPALTNGSDGGGAATASLDGGQSGEVGTSVAVQVDNKNGRDWQMLAIGAAIGVLASDVVVRRFRRN